MKIEYKPWATGIKDTTDFKYRAVPDDVVLNDVKKIIKKQNSMEVLNGDTWHTFNNIQAEIKTIEMSEEEREVMEDSSVI